MKVDEHMQREYYSKTASLYNEMHVRSDDEHYVSLKFISGIISTFNIASILDVGCGTGRAVKWFLEHHSSKVYGLEPVRAMIDQAIQHNGIDSKNLMIGIADFIPFKDQSFDAVCEFGVLHHVKNPNIIVKEMMRVARKAIFISDSNRFGQGPMYLRYMKLMLYKMNLLNLVYLIKNRGKPYILSESDGLSYSYSVFDSLDILSHWADRIILIPTFKGKLNTWLHPLLTSGHILLCALRD
jgi:ubiquinone/menaquinone biosynthesis C-methylase UbiE